MTTESVAEAPGVSRIRGAFLWLNMAWLAWAVLLGGAIVQGLFFSDGQFGRIGRLGSSVCLVVAGWLWAVACYNSRTARVALLIAIGMTLGCLGDFFNSGLLQSVIPLPNPTIGAIAAFGLGHIAYIAACAIVAKRARLNSKAALIGSIVAWQLIGVVCWYFVVYQGHLNRDVVVPSLPYTLLLAGTAGITTGLAVQTRRLTGLAFGGALFLLSDLILAWEMFRGDFEHAREAVWGTYGPGQMLIVFSVGAFAAVLYEIENADV